MREWWGDENEAASDPGLNLKKKRKENQALISSHFMLSTEGQTIPSQKSCMYFSEFKIKKINKNKNSYLSRWLLIYRLMYNIDKLNRDQ